MDSTSTGASRGDGRAGTVWGKKQTGLVDDEELLNRVGAPRSMTNTGPKPSKRDMTVPSLDDYKPKNPNVLPGGGNARTSPSGGGHVHAEGDACCPPTTSPGAAKSNASSNTSNTTGASGGAVEKRKAPAPAASLTAGADPGTEAGVVSYLTKQLQVRLWMEDILGERIAENTGSSRVTSDGKRFYRTDLFVPLRDGQLLCRLMLLLQKGSIPKVNKGASDAYLVMENIQFSLAAMSTFGVPTEQLFAPLDLYNRVNMPRVIACLYALAELAYKKGACKSNVSEKCSGGITEPAFETEDIRAAAADLASAISSKSAYRKSVKDVRPEDLRTFSQQLEDEVKKKDAELEELRRELKSKEQGSAAAGCCIVQ